MFITLLSFVYKLIVSVFLFGIGGVWGALTLFQLIVGVFTLGWSKIFTTKNRDDPPKYYHSWEYNGKTKPWNHAHVTLPESNMKFHLVYSGKFPPHLQMCDGNIVKKNPSPASSRLILCVHGFPECWFSWRYLLRDFDDSEYFVVAIDTRGYGSSDKPTSVSDYHTNLLTADLKSIVYSLGYKQCDLLGHDWGGVIAWLTLDNYPEILRSLTVLNCPHPAIATKFALGSPKQLFGKSWYMYFFQVIIVNVLNV